MTQARPATPLLQVYVAPGCAGCRTALEIVEALRHARPDQRVDVIDISDDPELPLPDGVVGTPTYLLNGRVISLGNPELPELLTKLDAATDPTPPRATRVVTVTCHDDARVPGLRHLSPEVRTGGSGLDDRRHRATSR